MTSNFPGVGTTDPVAKLETANLKHSRETQELAKRKHAPPVLRIEVSDSKRILRFHHKADCSKSTPDTMRCLRLIGDPNFIVLVRTGHKIDERRIEIHVVRH